MDKKILKTGAGLLLGVGLLIPTAPKAFATSTGSNLTSTQKTPADLFNETVAKAEAEVRRYKLLKTTDIKYINASSDLQREFNNYLGELDNAVSLYKGKVFLDDASYKTYTDYFNRVISDVAARYNKLDGKTVYGNELFTLTREVNEFKSSEAYKSASIILQNNYLTAIDKGNAAIALGVDKLTNVKNQEAIDAINAAKDAINKDYEKKSALANLRAEITLSNTIIKDRTKYTKESFEAYEAAYKSAKTTHENTASTLEQVQSATDLLKTLRRDLKKLPTTEEEKRLETIKRLEDAITNTRTTRSAAKLLMQYSPNIAKNNSKKLNELLAKSEKLEKEALNEINRLKGIKG